MCTDKLKNGVLYKPGTLKTPDSDITLQDSYNGGKTCTQTLSLTKDIPCGGLDAVCKKSDADLYDVQTDSNTACNINDGGVWKKEGTLKADALITITPKYGTGKTCTQQFSLKKNITCGPINALCPINDNSFYTFSTVAIKGTSIISPNSLSINSVTSKMYQTTDPGLFEAVIKVDVPSSYSTLGIKNYKVSVIDTFNNKQVNSTNNVLIDNNNNLTIKITHERQVSSSNYSYLGQDYEAISRAMINDKFNFDGTYKVTISSVDSKGVISPESAPVTFNSGLPPANTIQALLNTVNDV